VSGTDREAVEERLRVGFAAQGIPQPPESVEAYARVVAAGWPGALLGMVAGAVSGHPPVGFRTRERLLAGTRWIAVETVDNPSVRRCLAGLRSHDDDMAEMADAMAERAGGELPEAMRHPRRMRMRLFTVPTPAGERVGVFTDGHLYLGTVPRGSDAELADEFDDADAANEQLMVLVRSDGTAAAPGLQIQVP